MASELDKVIVVDVEATCWEGQAPPGEEMEIIEFGVCLLDVATGSRDDKTSLLIRPERSKVSEFCTQLTSLTQAQVDGGLKFVDACDYMRKRWGYQRTWASWGDFDRRQLERQCRERGTKYPFGRTHLNVKNLFALRRGLENEVGLDKAMEELGLPMEGSHHRGHDDAWNIARVLWELLRWR
jgi:inhibitor of KinA sporulation pathway (predicted exonuclease)